MKRISAFTFIIIMSIFFTSCNERKENQIVFKKLAPKKEDNLKTWLYEAKNYKTNKKYFSIFYNYYDQLIKQKKYLTAAETLDRTCILLADSYDFNERFMSTIKEFHVKYRGKIPALKSSFIDAYIANYYFDKSDLKTATIYLKKVTSLEPNDYDSCYNIGRANYDLSYLYYIFGKQSLSLEANQKAFEYFSKINNPKGLAFVYSNYANIYTAIGDKKRAINNADKAIKAYKSIDNTYNVYISLINKIAIYEFLRDESERPLIDSVYQAFVKSKDDSKILKIKIFNYKIENLLIDKNLNEAKKLLDDLKPTITEVNSEGLSIEYQATTALYALTKNPNFSDFEDIKKALPTLITNQQYEKVNLFYEVLQKNAIKNNDFKSALKYENDKKIIADSIGNISTRTNIAELETKYETQKKQQQIQLQEKTIVNKNTTIAFLASLFAALFLVVVVYINKQKQKKLQAEKQNAQQYTKQLLEKTEEERKRIASDLHDSVSHELLSLKNTFEEKTEVTNSKIDAIINDIRIISRNLHPIMFDKIGLKESIIQLVDRTQLTNNFMVTAEIDYSSDLLSSTELQIYRIVQESLSNIIKYAQAIAAKITIKENAKSILIEIKDNGKGFNVSETLNGKMAFGLHNIIERSRAIGGTTEIVSNKNGTIISIEIKK